MTKIFGTVIFILMVLAVMVGGYYLGKLLMLGIKLILSKFRKKGKVHDNIVRRPSESSRNS